jgi:hypothetical protein
MTFERYTELMTKCFHTLWKDPDQALSGHQKVEKLLKGINTQEGQLQGAIAAVDMSHPNDFAQACAYFSTQARVHGPAQLEQQRSGRRQHVSATGTTGSSHGGRGRGGRGRGRRRGRGCGRGGRNEGGRNNDRVSFNGIDATNIWQNYSAADWDRIGPSGRRYVMQQRDFRGDRGDGRGRGENNRGRGGRGDNAGRGIGAVDVEQLEDPQQDLHDSDRGGQNGRAFGRGAYGGRGGCGGRI